MSERARTDEGFTLVETIIAMILTAIVAGVIGTALNVITRSEQPARERLSTANDSLTLTDVFPADVASTPLSGRFVGPATTGCLVGSGSYVLGLRWADPPTGTTYGVGYQFDDAADTLVRVSCEGASTTVVRRVASDVAAVTLETDDVSSAEDVTLVVASTATPPTVTRVRGVRPQRGLTLLPAAPEPSPQPESGLIVRTELDAITHYDAVGEELRFRVALTNAGGTPLDQLAVTDPALERWATPCPGRLEPGATASCEFINDVSIGDIEQGAIQSATRVTGRGPNGTLTRFAPPVTVPAVRAPNLEVALQSSATGYVLATQRVRLDAVVRNTGNVTLTGVSVTDETEAMICNLPALAPLATTTCSYEVVVTPGDAVQGGTIRSLVRATASTTGAGVTASSNSVTVPYRGSIPPATPVPRLTVSLTTSPSGVFTAPTMITYEMKVSNVGDEPLTGVHVSAQSLSGVEPADCAVTDLPLRAETTCISQHWTSVPDTTGAVTNVVTVEGAGTSGVATATSASVTVSSLVPCTIADSITAAREGDRVLEVTVETFGHCDALRVRVRPTGAPSGVIAPLVVPPEGSGSTRTASVTNASSWPTGPATIDVLSATSMAPIASAMVEVT